MTLRQLLRTMTHSNYVLLLQEDRRYPEPIDVAKKRLQDYLDYQVLGVSEDWVITIVGLGEKIA